MKIHPPRGKRSHACFFQNKQWADQLSYSKVAPFWLMNMWSRHRPSTGCHFVFWRTISHRSVICPFVSSPFLALSSLFLHIQPLCKLPPHLPPCSHEVSNSLSFVTILLGCQFPRFSWSPVGLCSPLNASLCRKFPEEGAISFTCRPSD